MAKDPIQRLKLLLEKRTKNLLSEKEKKELYEFLNSTDNDNIISSEFYIHWNQSPKKLPKIDSKILFNKIREEANFTEEQQNYYELNYLTKPFKTKFYTFLKHAAIFILGFFSLFIYNQVSSGKMPATEQHYNEVSVQHGSKSLVTLPDGSQVWLNSGSKIIYPDRFSEDERNVSLVGEAFFDVSKNEHKPFIVKAGNLDIKVLGTRFNVKSYPTDNYTETLLESGSVELHKQGTPEEELILLKPNQKAIVYKSPVQKENTPEETISAEKQVIKKLDKKLVNIESVKEPAEITSWKDGELRFNAEPFYLLAEKMERWFDVKIIFESENSKNIRYTGVFQNETIEQAMKALSYSFSIKYTIDKNIIYIHN